MKYPFYVITSPVAVPIILALLYHELGLTVFAGYGYIVIIIIIVILIQPVVEDTRY